MRARTTRKGRTGTSRLASESYCRCGRWLTKMQLVLLLSSLVLCASLMTGDGLQIQRLDVPHIADPTWDKVSLRCVYDLDGKELYSVTWYKDGIEFFKFMPGSPGREYYIDGVFVDISQSDHERVTLLGPNTRKGKVNLAGSYACEVSSEGPNFQTDYRVANMSVAVLPKGPPVLDGVRPSYEVGEILEAECTSALSYPPAVLTFILNGREVNRALIKDLRGGSYVDGNAVSSTRLGLTVRLERQHFPGGSLTLICRSTLPGMANSMAQETSRIATLAASNQRLAQEPPRSGSGSRFESYSALICCWLLLVIHAIRCDFRRSLRA